MSGFGDIGLAAAERLEKSVGPKVALRSYKALLDGNDKRVVMAAALGVMRCALASEDRDALDELAGFWPKLTEHDAFVEVAAQCRLLVSASRLDEALALSAAEVARRPSPRALYLEGRVRSLRGEPGAALARFAAAAEAEAQTEADRAAVDASRIAMLERMGPDAAEAAALAAAIDADAAAPAARLLVAEALLSSPSRFVRARALSLLEALAALGDEALARRAVWIAAAHADRHAAALSWVEADRVGAAIARWPDPAAADRARAALSLLREASGGEREALARACRAAASPRYLELATAVVEGVDIDADAVVEAASAAERTATRGLAIIASLRAGQRDAAWRHMLALPERWTPPVPPSVWTAQWLALASGDERLCARAGDVVRALAPLGPPPRGYLPFALRLDDDGLLERAAARGEPGAREALSAKLVRAGWDAFESGDREAALRLLRRAKRLAGDPPAAPA